MGLFSSKKVITVASVVYNLAGDEADRPNYLQGLVVRNILSGTKDSMGTTLQNGLLNGPAMKLRSFYRWTTSLTNYDQVGLPTGVIEGAVSINGEDLAPHITADPGLEVWVQKAEAGGADFSIWADQWILENQPADIETAYTVDYNEAANEITITFVDLSTAVFTPADFDSSATYIYAYYTLVDPGISYSVLKVFIYRVGSGNATLDALVLEGESYGEFYPFIPIRLWNEFISESYRPAVFEQTKKAYKKATGSELSKLQESLEDNDDLDKIDHAYVVFGVSLNVQENACKRYLYKFFQKLMRSQNGGEAAYDQWVIDQAAALAVADAWNAWNDGGQVGPEPERPDYPSRSTNRIRIKGEGETNSQYDIRIEWAFIGEGDGVGLGKAGAKTGDCWFEVLSENTIFRDIFSGTGTYSDEEILPIIRLFWQRTDDTYTYLDIVDARHYNVVYDGRWVRTLANEAIEDTEESGFIVPLHYQTYREISLADASQMATACVFLVLNCYQVDKVRWYERGIFKIIFVIVLAIISVVFTGGAGIGLLGAHMSIGTALGFSGLTAAIVGSIVNALAALVLSTLLESVVSKFGIIGQIIGAVFMVLAGSLAGSFQNGFSLTLNWNDILRADNLLKLTDAVGRGVTNMLNQDTLGLSVKMQDYLEYAQEETKKIQEAYLKEFGYGTTFIDPLMFVDSPSLIVESSDTFLTRTLMTGSEIAEMSQELLYGFPEFSLKLPDAFT